MALPSSGQISLGDIAGEISLLLSNISLQTASTSAVLNQNSTFGPDGSEPHAISEFLGYDQSASSGLKRMLGGENQGTKVDYRDPSLCTSSLFSNFYWHSGFTDVPVAGNFIYTSDGTSNSAEEGVYVFTQGLQLVGEEPVDSFTVVALLDVNGRIKNIAACESSGGSKGDLGIPFEGAIPVDDDKEGPIVDELPGGLPPLSRG